MPRTPDYFPGQRKEDSILMLSGSATPVSNGEFMYVSGSGFQFMDEGVIKTLVTPSGSGISESQHVLLRQLIHLADDDGPRGTGWPSGLFKEAGPWPFPTASIWWVSSARAQRVVDAIITRNGMQQPTQIVWRAYGPDGVSVVESYTDTITYAGAFETSRTRT